MTIIAQAGDWIGESTSTIGQGDVSLGAPLDGFTNFNQLADGLVWYTIVEGLNRETGVGTLSGRNLQRTTVYATIRNGVYYTDGSKISLTGTGEVYSTFTAKAFLEINTALNNVDAIFEDYYDKTEIDSQQAAQDAIITQNTNAAAANSGRLDTIDQDIVDIDAELLLKVGKNSDVGKAQLPVGTTAEGGTPDQGAMRYDTELESFVGGNGDKWGPIGGGGSVKFDVVVADFDVSANGAYAVDMSDEIDKIATIPALNDEDSFVIKVYLAPEYTASIITLIATDPWEDSEVTEYYIQAVTNATYSFQKINGVLCVSGGIGETQNTQSIIPHDDKVYAIRNGIAVQAPPNHNYIINGNLQEWQRKGPAVDTYLDEHCADRFYTTFVQDFVAHRNFDAGRSLDYFQGPDSHGVFHTSELVNRWSAHTRIESEDIRGTYQGKMTLSFDLAYEGIVNPAEISAFAARPTGVDDFSTVDEFHNTVLETNVTGDSVFKRYSMTFDMDDLASANGLHVQVDVKASEDGTVLLNPDGTMVTVRLTNVKLENCEFDTPFVADTVSENLAKCKRYYQFGGNGASGQGENNALQFSGATTNGLSYIAAISFPVAMRVAPATSLTNLFASGFPTDAGSVYSSEGGIVEERFSNAPSGSSRFITGWVAAAEL